MKSLLKSAKQEIKFLIFLDSGGPWPEKKILGSGPGDLGSDGLPIKINGFPIKINGFPI